MSVEGEEKGFLPSLRLHVPNVKKVIKNNIGIERQESRVHFKHSLQKRKGFSLVRRREVLSIVDKGRLDRTRTPKPILHKFASLYGGMTEIEEAEEKTRDNDLHRPELARITAIHRVQTRSYA